MKQDIYLGMRLVHVNVDSTQVFLTINNTGIKINVDMNAKHWLTKLYVIKDSIVILVYVIVNVTNHVMFENIWIMKIVSIEKK